MANMPTNSESTYFEIDRSTVSTELRALQRTIKEGAKQIDMVAAERVFDQSLSRALVRRARKLHLVARDLSGLIRLVGLARFRGTAKQLESATVLPFRRSARN
jgi:predicted ATP-dependent protease